MSARFDKSTWWEMVQAARVGHPTALAWLWWQRWIGLWVAVARCHAKMSRRGLGDDVRRAFSRGELREEDGWSDDDEQPEEEE